MDKLTQEDKEAQYRSEIKGMGLVHSYYQIFRGDLYYANLDPVVGSEQGGLRPVIIVQDDHWNDKSPTLIVLPITSREKPALPTHVSLSGTAGLQKPSYVLAEQIRTIDKFRLRRYIGSVNNIELDAVDTAILQALGMLKPSATNKSNIKTLCLSCRKQYEEAGYQLMLAGSVLDAKEQCDFCMADSGFDYEVSGG